MRSVFFVGITHTLNHYEAKTANFELQVSDNPDDASDNSKNIAAVHHCYGCSGVALPAIGVLAFAGSVTTKLAFLPTERVRAHDPALATPPPKF